jgi:hypothetical protein
MGLGLASMSAIKYSDLAPAGFIPSSDSANKPAQTYLDSEELCSLISSVAT